MPDERIELPAAYELIVFERIESLRAEAVRLANQDADEGTIVWAHTQDRAQARASTTWENIWICGEEDLHCSIILRPDFSIEKYHQILVVAATSLGNAIAGYLSPMIALAYGWPNKLLIANHKIAGLWMDVDPAQAEWLIVTCAVNIKHSPNDFSIAAMSISDAEGGTELTASQLLESYAREFISQINKWDDRGFHYILKQWKGRMNGIEKHCNFRVGMEEYAGVCASIDDDGAVCFTEESGKAQCLSIEQYMGI
ncbi:MAG: hypothetical protein GKR96_06970 [Gammaproteobacteria bacterium]|nr:hypothetical protein [Gammaproteobacteria bacterium]